jgi:hypothetical protein
MLRTKQRSIAMNTSKLMMRLSFSCRTLLALIIFAIAVTIFTSAASGESVPYRYTGQIHFDVKRIPFSRFGSYLSISDLSAYLSVQMEVLTDVAARLGRPAEARQWKQQSNQLLERMVQRFWRDGAFVAIHVTDGRPIRSQSLLLDMPIILGTRLPSSVQAKLIADLRKRASESSFGLASEPENSPCMQRMVTGGDRSGRPRR